VTFAPAPAPDTTPPETSTPSGGPDSSTTETEATFDLGGTDDVSHGYDLGYQCSLDGSAFATCSTPVSYTGLSVGEHTFSVRAVDGAGNVDPTPETHTWVIEEAPAPPADTTAPDTSISSGPEASTTETTATFALSSNESGSSFECALDGGAFAACTSPWTVTSLAPGSHTVAVRSIDTAGNVDATPATFAWSIEAVPACVAATVKVGSVGDSWVLQDSAQSNYGTDSVLKVVGKTNANARLLVQFSLPAIPEGCQIQSATLRLYAGSHKNGRTLQAYQVSGNWSESGVTWGNQPATTGPAATTSSGSGWRTWNVTGQVGGMYAGANKGFLVRDASESGGGSEQGFHSREKGSDRPPELIVVFG